MTPSQKRFAFWFVAAVTFLAMVVAGAADQMWQRNVSHLAGWNDFLAHGDPLAWGALAIIIAALLGMMTTWFLYGALLLADYAYSTHTKLKGWWRDAIDSLFDKK